MSPRPALAVVVTAPEDAVILVVEADRRRHPCGLLDDGLLLCLGWHLPLPRDRYLQLLGLAPGLTILSQ